MKIALSISAFFGVLLPVAHSASAGVPVPFQWVYDSTPIKPLDDRHMLSGLGAYSYIAPAPVLNWPPEPEEQYYFSENPGSAIFPLEFPRGLPVERVPRIINACMNHLGDLKTYAPILDRVFVGAYGRRPEENRTSRIERNDSYERRTDFGFVIPADRGHTIYAAFEFGTRKGTYQSGLLRHMLGSADDRWGYFQHLTSVVLRLPWALSDLRNERGSAFQLPHPYDRYAPPTLVLRDADCAFLDARSEPKPLSLFDPRFSCNPSSKPRSIVLGAQPGEFFPYLDIDPADHESLEGPKDGAVRIRRMNLVMPASVYRAGYIMTLATLQVDKPSDDSSTAPTGLKLYVGEYVGCILDQARRAAL